MVKLIIARHCQTVGNKQRIFQGSINTPVSEDGIFQLGLVSARLRDEKIDVIYSSPQERAVTTAKYINKFHEVPIIEHEGLREINAGDLEGMLFAEIPNHYKKEASDWNEKFYDFDPPNGESVRTVFERTGIALKEIIENNDGKTVLITSHGCAIRNIMCHLAQLPIERIMELSMGTNTAISVAEVDGENSKVVLLSDCSHLADSMYDKNKKQFLFEV